MVVTRAAHPTCFACSLGHHNTRLLFLYIQSSLPPFEGSQDSLLPPLFSFLSINLIERPRIRKAGIPDLVDDLDSLDVILAPGPRHDGRHGPRAHAVLELLRQPPVAPRHRLPSPPTLAAQHRGSDLFISGNSFVSHLVCLFLSRKHILKHVVLGKKEEEEKRKEKTKRKKKKKKSHLRASRMLQILIPEPIDLPP